MSGTAGKMLPAAGLLFGSASYDAYFAANFTPTAWWKLNEVSGSTAAADSSGNGWTATVNSTGITFGNAAGPTGDTCLEAIGNALIGSLETSLVGAGTTFSLVAWFASLNNQNQNASGIILENSGGSGTQGVVMAVSTVSGAVDNVYINVGAANCQYNTTPAAGTWHMIAATFDGTNVRLYLDGVLVAGPTAATLSWRSGYSWTMLNYPGATGGASSLACYLAEVAVFHGSVLTPTQIANLYAAA